MAAHLTYIITKIYMICKFIIIMPIGLGFDFRPVVKLNKMAAIVSAHLKENHSVHHS